MRTIFCLRLCYLLFLASIYSCFIANFACASEEEHVEALDSSQIDSENDEVRLQEVVDLENDDKPESCSEVTEDIADTDQSVTGEEHANLDTEEDDFAILDEVGEEAEETNQREGEEHVVDSESIPGQEKEASGVFSDDNEKSTLENETMPVDNEAKTFTQSGPFIDLLGESLLSLEMIDETHAQFVTHLTNDVIDGKKVVGLFFSADWCGACKQFTPELVQFYDKINTRRGRKGQFEIVWISRCRDFDSFGQYFTHMKWFAMQPEDAMGSRGQRLLEKYKVKGIPTLVLLDELGNVITSDARNKIPADRAGIGFPWRNPFVAAYITLLPKSLRYLIRSNIKGIKNKLLFALKGAVGMKTV